MSALVEQHAEDRPSENDVAAAPVLSESPSRAGAWGLLRGLVRGHRTVLAVGLAMAAASSVAALFSAVLVGRLSDAALRGDRDLAVALAVVGIVVAVVQVVTGGLGQAWLARAGERVVRDLRDHVVVRLLAAPLRFVERHRAGDLVQRSTAEVAALSGFVRDSFGQVVLTAMTLLAAVVVLALESWQLLLAVMLGFGPAAWLLLRAFRRRAVRAYAVEAAAEADVMASFAEIVRTRSLLHEASKAGRGRVLDGLDHRGDAALRGQMRTVTAGFWVNAMALVEGVSLALLLLVGVVLVDADTLSVGVVVTFVVAGRTVFTAFTDLSALVADVEETATGLARAHDLLDLADSDHGMADPLAGRPLVASGVGFGYDGSPVLRDLDLSVPAGDRVCLVGRTGAGKSTFAKLLAGLYPPDVGSVRLGGVDLATLSPDVRARHVAYVPQQVQLGPGDLRDELRLAAPDAGDDDLAAAFERLGLGEWLAGLPSGLDTRAAHELSTGERQLVALARVTLSAAPVLVLDEATSDLDAATSALVERALDRLAEGRTLVVVAHRPETIATFDRVVSLTPIGG